MKLHFFLNELTVINKEIIYYFLKIEYYYSYESFTYFLPVKLRI